MNIDKIISKALEEEFEERVEQCFSDTKRHRFSLSYRLWERKMLRDLRRDKVNAHWTLRRIRTAVVSCIVAAFMLVGGTVFAVVSMGRYIFDTKPDHSKLFIENLSSDKTTIEEHYGLPEESGWRIVDFYFEEFRFLIKYLHGEETITFDQRIIHEGSMGNINTENAYVEPISLHEENDGFFIKFQDGGCGLYWIYDGYLFSVIGDIAKNELVDLAYSIKIIDYSKII